jgi:hypothetical protein
VEIDEPDLVRYWFEFDLAGHEPDPRSGQIQLDGGTPAYRLLARGAGVTGYDEPDCLGLLRAALRGELPPVLRAQRNPVIDEHQARQVGNVAWRGVWFPALNLGGPTTT